MTKLTPSVFLFVVSAFYLTISNPVRCQKNWQELADYADSLRRSGDYESSIPVYEEVLRSSDLDYESLLMYKVRLGISFFMFGEDDAAIHHYQSVIQSTEKDTSNIYRGHAFNNLGLVYDNKGSFSASIRHYEQAASIYYTCEQTFLYNLAQMNMGIVLKKQGNYTKALEKLTHSAALFEQEGDSLQLGEVYSSIGGIQESLGNYANAVNYYNRSLIIRLAIADHYGTASIYNNIGGVFMIQGKIDSAITCFNHAITLMKEYGERNLGNSYHNLGLCFLSLDKQDEAEKYLIEALEHKISFSDSNEIVITAHELAELHLTQHDPEQAYHFIEMARNYIGMPVNKANLQANYELRKNYFKSINLADSALMYLEEATYLQYEINREAYMKEAAALQISYENESHQRIIQRLQNQNYAHENALKDKSIVIRNLKTSLNSILIGLFVLLLLILIVIYFIWQRTAREKLIAQLDGVELEKQRLSMELHEAAGSEIRGLKLQMQSIVQENKDPKLVGHIKPLLRTLEIVSNEIVMVSHALYHPQIETEQFSLVLEDFLFDWFNDSNYVFEKNLAGIEALNNLTKESKSHIYRCFQEILINIKRHANATKITIDLNVSDEYIQFIITDNGKGIKEYKTPGIGIINLKKRAILMKGVFSITPLEKSPGTRAELTIPKKDNIEYAKN